MEYFGRGWYASPDGDGGGGGNGDAGNQGSPGDSAGLDNQGEPKEGGAQTLTLEQVQTLVDERVQDALRQGQSYADKAVAASNRALGQRFSEIDATLSTLEAAGQEIAPGARDALRAKAMEDFYAGQGADEDEGAGDGSRPGGNRQELSPEQQAAQAAAQEGYRRMQAAGVIITQQSPAFKTIDQTTKDTDAFLASVDKAIGEHKAWLADGGRSSGDGEDEEAEGEGDGQGSRPGKGMQLRGEGKRSGDLPADASPRDKFTAGFNASK